MARMGWDGQDGVERVSGDGVGRDGVGVGLVWLGLGWAGLGWGWGGEVVWRAMG